MWRPARSERGTAALVLFPTWPEPMRPGRAEAMRTTASLIPHARLIGIQFYKAKCRI
jgi:hypothetical protein